MTTPASSSAAVKTLVRAARFELRVKKDPVRALELVTEVDPMLADMDADANVRADIYASVASLWRDLGDGQRSEQRIVQAIETEAQVTPARPVILGTHKLFYAQLLHTQQRFAEAARHASEGLAIYAQGVDPDYPELARLRVFLAPILRHRAADEHVRTHEQPMSASRSCFALAGEVVGAHRMEIAAALDAMPVRVYLPDDNNEVNLCADDFSVSIYPWEPEGGNYFLMLGNIDLNEAAARDLMNALIRALESRSIAARVELESEDDVDIYETAMWNPGAPERVRGPAKPGLVLGLPLRSGAGGEVRVGTLGDQPVLITLTMHHDAPYTQLADELRLAFDGIAPLESIGPAEGSYGGDMMIERLPAGRPATDVARLSVPSLAQLGAAIAHALARVHAAKTVIAGVQPQLIYVDDDGRFTGLVPRGPRFIYSAPAPSGLRSYPVPYIGYEELGGQPPSPAGDVFALCASLFELGSGIHPFGGDPTDLRPLLTRMVADEREPWPAGGALTELLARGLAQRPDERPTAAVLASELTLLASGARHPRKVA